MFPLAAVFDAVASAVPQRQALVHRDKRVTFEQLNKRSDALASYLANTGVGCDQERATLKPWQSGQAHVALYLRNCTEYLEAMLGCFKARAAPFNVNYRYVEDELRYLFNDAKPSIIIYHRDFAEQIRRIKDQLSGVVLYMEVDEDYDHPADTPAVQGAVIYEQAISANLQESFTSHALAEDLYLVYTGGTTGMPKGVLWRQLDVLQSVLGGSDKYGDPLTDLQQFATRASRVAQKVLIAPPFMHAAGQWVACNSLFSGQTVVIQDIVETLDPTDVWRTAEREKVDRLLIVGDAFAVPLLDALDNHAFDLSGLKFVHSTGAPLHISNKTAFMEKIPGLSILDTIGSSEGGRQGQVVTHDIKSNDNSNYAAANGGVVVDESRQSVLPPGHKGIGWWAMPGTIPLGYLNDAEKTRNTFITVENVRMSIPGDRARHLANDRIELLGRDSVTINSGGEKIFAEEVEAALRNQNDVYDVVVVGRPSKKWGSEVVAIVQLRASTPRDSASLHEVAAKTLARYKLPKAYVFVDEIVRSPSGKADYRWARSVADAH